MRIEVEPRADVRYGNSFKDIASRVIQCFLKLVA